MGEMMVAQTKVLIKKHLQGKASLMAAEKTTTTRGRYSDFVVFIWWEG